MAFNFQTFKTRALTAIIFVAIMLLGLLYNQWSFLALFTIIHFGCWVEYQKIIALIHPAFKQAGILQRYGVMLAGWGFMLSMAGDIYTTTTFSVHYTGIIILLVGIAMLLFDLIKNFTTANGIFIQYSFLGFLYISISWGLMIGLRSQQNPFTGYRFEMELGWVIPVVLIASIWINDTMAYIVGSFIGKTPLSPISPKKTWEGTIGGAILCIAAVTLGGYYLFHIPDYVSLLAIATIAAIVGTLGDLLESKLKRMANLKDSGHIMPGHGGFLDRFDSLVLATPIVYIYLQLI